MPNHPPRPVTPTGQIRAKEFRRLAGEVGRRSHVAVGGWGGMRDDGGGLAVTDEKPQRLWIKITGGGTDGLYDWVQVIFINSTTTVEPADAISGTEASLPAKEVNGNAGVSVDTIVEAVVSESLDCLLFSIGRPGSGSGGVRVITCVALRAAGGGSGSGGSVSGGGI